MSLCGTAMDPVYEKNAGESLLDSTVVRRNYTMYVGL